MKLLVFAHVPPPHHGQAVMVELMLRGLREKAETLKTETLKFSEGIEGEPRGTPVEYLDQASARLFNEEEHSIKQAQETSSLHGVKRSSRIEGEGRDVRPRASANVDEWPQKGAKSTERGECRGTEVEEGEDLRFKFKIQESRRDETTLDPDQDLAISGEEVGQTRRCPPKETCPIFGFSAGSECAFYTVMLPLFSIVIPARDEFGH